MSVKKKLLSFIMFYAVIFTLLVGCSDGKDVTSEGVDDEEKEDITLTLMMWTDWGQDYEQYIKEAVENEFPHITLENVGGDTGNKEWIEKALAAGVVPDLIFAHRQYHVALLEEYELGYDISSLLELHDFDLSRYDSAHLDEWKTWTNGEIWLLPFMRDVYALHYNKDIFDLFGVNYPTDVMTWNEVIELAIEVTGERNGT